jgi:mono/diheme cytochrome c family protein
MSNQQQTSEERISTETRVEIERRDRRIKIGLLAVSSLTVILLIAAATGENLLARWRLLRGGYVDLLKAKATDDFGRSVARAFSLEIDQNVLPETGDTDRCITCHTGVDDPRMQDAPQPYTTHPGRYLQIHEPAKFGCTICHEGQGRATTAADAHGHVPFWNYPMLEPQYMKSGCAKCHTVEELLGPERLIDRADAAGAKTRSSRQLDRGWRLIEEHGCLGCHTLDGKGGNLGPDITRVGEKTPHELTFAHLDAHEPRRTTTWLEQHFLDPQAVSPGSLMPNVNLSEEEAEALTAVMLSLRTKRPRSPEPAAARAPRQESGGVLYAKYCSACHGADGEGDSAPGIHTPSLNNDDMLAVADDEYLLRIIASGRSGTHMPAWEEGQGNLSPGEIRRIVDHVRDWEAGAASPGEVRASLGDPRIGQSYYQGLCANCHGARGSGGIGNRLNSPSFLAIAPDRFLAETIIHGRPGTAMPSWKSLSAEAVSDILATIRLWQAEPPTFQEVKAEMKAEPRKRLAGEGREIYGLYCASCHGREGEGGIGLDLSTPDLLRVVDDRFLYRTIVEGRPATAMPAWRHLTTEQLAAILSYLRSWQQGEAINLQKALPTGDYLAGEAHYAVSCQSCHGEKGGGGLGPQISNPVFLSSVSDPQLFHWISRGRAGTAMKGFLPEEQGPTSLTRKQIVDVIAYLRFIAKGGETPIRRIGEGDAAVGRALFRGSCASCHGSDGEGASGPQLNNRAFLKSASDGFLAATIVLGREGTPMRSMVHGQQGLGQIAPEQVQDLIAFMRLWEGPQPAGKPRMSVEMSERAISSGREHYSSYCAACHGANGRGRLDGLAHYAPALNNQDFLRAASDGFLLATIARGRRGTPMRPFGEGAGGIVSLNWLEISDIVSYLRSWQEGPAFAGGTRGGTRGGTAR